MPKRKEKPSDLDIKTERFLNEPREPVPDFRAVVRKVLATSKVESDRQLAEQQAKRRQSPE